MQGGCVTIRTSRWKGDTKEDTVGWIVNCECGETVRAEDEDGVITGVSSHVESKHPDLIGALSREDILAMAEQS